MWSWEFAFDVFPIILRGMWVTLLATVVAFAIALVFGLLLSIGRRSKFKPVYWTVTGFVEFVRTTPPLVQLYFVFYVLPLYGVSLSPFAAGAITLGLHYSTYCSEIYRSGIESVSRGQWEAATALNFLPLQKWTRVVLPQAIPPIIPMLGNYLIVLFKETPLLSAITLVEMLQTAKIIGSETFRYLEPVTIVGVLFLLLSYFSAILIRRLEDKMNRRHGGKGQNKKGKEVLAS
jgi:polar amino acid transport system permease protein